MKLNTNKAHPPVKPMRQGLASLAMYAGGAAALGLRGVVTRNILVYEMSYITNTAGPTGAYAALRQNMNAGALNDAFSVVCSQKDPEANMGLSPEMQAVEDFHRTMPADMLTAFGAYRTMKAYLPAFMARYGLYNRGLQIKRVFGLLELLLSFKDVGNRTHDELIESYCNSTERWEAQFKESGGAASTLDPKSRSLIMLSLTMEGLLTEIEEKVREIVALSEREAESAPGEDMSAMVRESIYEAISDALIQSEENYSPRAVDANCQAMAEASIQGVVEVLKNANYSMPAEDPSHTRPEDLTRATEFREAFHTKLTELGRKAGEMARESANLEHKDTSRVSQSSLVLKELYSASQCLMDIEKIVVEERGYALYALHDVFQLHPAHAKDLIGFIRDRRDFLKSLSEDDVSACSQYTRLNRNMLILAYESMCSYIASLSKPIEMLVARTPRPELYMPKNLIIFLYFDKTYEELTGAAWLKKSKGALVHRRQKALRNMDWKAGSKARMNDVKLAYARLFCTYLQMLAGEEVEQQRRYLISCMCRVIDRFEPLELSDDSSMLCIAWFAKLLNIALNINILNIEADMGYSFDDVERQEITRTIEEGIPTDLMPVAPPGHPQNRWVDSAVRWSRQALRAAP